MGVDYIDKTALTDAFKNVYGDMHKQFESEAITYNQFEKSERQPKGKGYVFGVKYADPQGILSTGESMLLPQPLVGKYDQATIQPKYHYGTLKFTGPAINAGKGDLAAFVDTQADHVEGMYSAFLVDMNRQCHSDGFGLLATLSAASDALTTSSTTWTITCDNNVGLMYAQEGMVVDFYQSTAIDQSSVASRISTIDLAGKTAEMEFNDGTYKAYHQLVAARSYTIATDTVASGSYMVRSGVRAASHATTNTAYELCGLEGLFDDGTLLATFEGITVASYPKWKAHILSNSSVDRELSVDLLLQAVQLSRRNAPTKKTIIRMGEGQQRKYFNLLAPDARFAPTKFDGGWTKLTFSVGSGNTEIMIDPYTQPGKIYIEPEGTIKKYESLPLEWYSEDGSPKHRVSGYDEEEMFLRMYAELGVERRNALVKISDLVEPSIYS